MEKKDIQQLIVAMQDVFPTAEMVQHGFDDVKKKFEKIDMRFEKIDMRFNAIDARFDKIDTRFEKVDARFDDMDARFDRIENLILKRHEEEIEELKIRVRYLENMIAPMIKK